MGQEWWGEEHEQRHAGSQVKVILADGGYELLRVNECAVLYAKAHSCSNNDGLAAHICRRGGSCDCQTRSAHRRNLCTYRSFASPSAVAS